MARVSYEPVGGGGGTREACVSLSAKGQNLLAFSATFRARFGLKLHSYARLEYDDEEHKLFVLPSAEGDPGAMRLNARGADANGGGLYVTARGAMRFFNLIVETTCLLAFDVTPGKDGKGWREITLHLHQGTVTNPSLDAEGNVPDGNIITMERDKGKKSKVA